MEKGYKFRIYPNEEQKIQMEKTCGCCRFVYNHYLSKRIEVYKEEDKKLTLNECNKDLTSLKQSEESNWLKDVDKFALYYSLDNLDKAYDNFFREKEKGNNNQGFPNFKKKHKSKKRYKTAYTNGNIEVGEDYVKLPKLGKVKAVIHRSVEGRIINATVEHSSSDKYYVSIGCTDIICHDITTLDMVIKSVFPYILEIPYLVYMNVNSLERIKSKDNYIGVDLGITHFAIDSNGLKYENNKYYRKEEKKLGYNQKKLSKKVPGSKRYRKQRIKVARLHEKIRNQRRDYLAKLSSKLINENQVICLEDLAVSNMVRNEKLSKAISEVSWAEFRRMVEYKAHWYGKQVLIVDRFYASSKTCSSCGYKLETLDLSVREWLCPQCNLLHDRDINAAKGLLKEGLNKLRGRNCPRSEPVELPQ
jgi:putative transposase